VFHSRWQKTFPAFVPYGVPQTTIVGDWLQLFDNRVGVWSLPVATAPGAIDIAIRNASDHPNWTKNIWIQITWERQAQAAEQLAQTRSGAFF